MAYQVITEIKIHQWSIISQHSREYYANFDNTLDAFNFGRTNIIYSCVTNFGEWLYLLEQSDFLLQFP